MVTSRRLTSAALAVAGGLALGLVALRVPAALVAMLAVTLVAASTGYGKSDAP
jgi:hypothetical protein